jgi:rhamnose utilization protein RhaD (predicted bifunctional aldolase and dehydrogenase)/NAD(P)-dependent dehydrogenase (short-subunit alcohol dehydrogenase family)
MRNRWSDSEALDYPGLLGSCVYASRLVGAESGLVLHGGGNSSVKSTESDVYGNPIETLWVKGSGRNLAECTRECFAPLELQAVRKMLAVESMSDTVMAQQLRASMLDVSAPSPSVEAMIHAAIPYVVVLHAHPNAILSISNTPDGLSRIEDVFGRRVVVVPYARSGFRVGRAAAIELERHLSDETVGIVLMNHGLFTLGHSAEQAYDRMIDLVSLAETYIDRHGTGPRSAIEVGAPPEVDRVELASLRTAISEVAGRPFILAKNADPEGWAFSQDPDVESLASRGPATPDQVIWTKTFPMFGRDVDAFAEEYVQYYEDHKHLATGTAMLDPAPRVILDDEFGLLTAGQDVASADAACEIYLQTIEVIQDATCLGGYRALAREDFFDLEYWDLEQEKVHRAEQVGEFVGEIAVVTGAASGIGRACAAELLSRGAAVVGFDIDKKIEDTFRIPEFLGLRCDLTQAEDVSAALDLATERFGGVDMLVASAGLFPHSAPISSHDPVAWQKAMSVNADALALLLAQMHPLLALSPRGGRVTVVGSKNITAPGPGASAYSASKAAANQLARVAALEWAADGIRVNSVHPDAVFDTALWTDELLAERSERYGLSVEEYKKRNLLGLEITSADVAGVVVVTLGQVFSSVTGAHIPIDGGNDRVI